MSATTKGADVHAYAVVKVGVPADGLFRERLPANEEVVGRLAFEDQFEAGLQLLGGLEAGVAARFAGVHGSLLAADPVAEIGVGELFQIGVGELVVVHQRAETALVSVPDVPDEWTMMEERAMLLEEIVPQPFLERLALAALRSGAGNQRTEVDICPSACTKSSRRRSAAGASPLVAERQTMPSSSASFSSPSGPSAGQSGKLEPVWRGHW